MTQPITPHHRFRAAGGVVERRKVNDLGDLTSYQVILNCSGLGARELCGDIDVYPMRGQVIQVS